MLRLSAMLCKLQKISHQTIWKRSKNIKSFENEIDQKIRKIDLAHWSVNQLVKRSNIWSFRIRINLSDRSIQWTFRSTDWILAGNMKATGWSTELWNGRPIWFKPYTANLLIGEDSPNGRTIVHLMLQRLYNG